MSADGDVIVIDHNGGRMDGKIARQVVGFQRNTANTTGGAVDIEKAMEAGIELPVVISGKAPTGVVGSDAVCEDLHGFASDSIRFFPLKVRLRRWLKYGAEHAAELSPGKRSILSPQIIVLQGAALSVHFQRLPGLGIVVETEEFGNGIDVSPFPAARRIDGTIRSLDTHEIRQGIRVADRALAGIGDHDLNLALRRRSHSFGEQCSDREACAPCDTIPGVSTLASE